MVDLIIRPAVEQDCQDIARLFVVSSDGLAELVWRTECRSGETIIDVGARRCARTGVPFSYENCVVVERKVRWSGYFMLILWSRRAVLPWRQSSPFFDRSRD
jgi:hypothetical protein